MNEIDHDADRALIARMLAKDEQALGVFYDRWEDAVRVAVLAIVREPSDAEEIVEAAFWQAWQQAARYDRSRGHPVAWLLTIARSRALDRRRAQKRAPESTSLDESTSSGPEFATESDDPLRQVERGEQVRHIRAALETLPRDQRESLELAYFQGLSQTEVAQRTGLPLGTVKTRTRLGLQKLRESLTGLRDVEGRV